MEWYAIKHPSGKIYNDVSRCYATAWISAFHWVDKDFSEWKRQPHSDRHAREHQKRYDENVEKLKQLGYELIVVSVTPKPPQDTSEGE